MRSGRPLTVARGDRDGERHRQRATAVYGRAQAAQRAGQRRGGGVGVPVADADRAGEQRVEVALAVGLDAVGLARDGTAASDRADDVLVEVGVVRRLHGRRVRGERAVHRVDDVAVDACLAAELLDQHEAAGERSCVARVLGAALLVHAVAAVDDDRRAADHDGQRQHEQHHRLPTLGGATWMGGRSCFDLLGLGGHRQAVVVASRAGQTYSMATTLVELTR